MQRARGWAAKALVVAACLIYQYGAHATIPVAERGAAFLVLLWAPLAVAAAWILLRSRHKLGGAGVLAAIGAVVYVAEQQGLGAAATSGLGHAAGYLFLLWCFGRTLARGREPLVTRFARGIHGALSPDMEAFTRRVTIAWCVFFAGQLAVSALLLAAAPLHAWSLFVNVLSLPLLAVMFLGQFVYRRLRHPGFPRATPWQGMQAFLRDASAWNRPEMR